MDIYVFWDYMIKPSKCGPHASKMKSWILYRLRSTQKYPEVPKFWSFIIIIIVIFFNRPKMTEVSYLLSHFNAFWIMYV